MYWSRCLVVLIVLLATVSSSSGAIERSITGLSIQTKSATSASYSRSCIAKDLPGTWRLVKFDSQYQFKDPQAPYLLPHQLFLFAKDGGLKSAHSAQPINQDTKKMFAGIPLAITYTLVGEGLVRVQARGTVDAMEIWRCVTITQDRNDEKRHTALRRGDVVMTLVGKNGQPLFLRQLRKDAA